eukprot:m.128676 g.128676  ORF g.128676 m.128676 type:complete len:62 (-) comp15676_c0_seq7:748-933(-)
MGELMITDPIFKPYNLRASVTNKLVLLHILKTKHTHTRTSSDDSIPLPRKSTAVAELVNLV